MKSQFDGCRLYFNQSPEFYLKRHQGTVHTWSPHSFTIGMLMSSMNTVIFFPAGGPYVVPTLLST